MVRDARSPRFFALLDELLHVGGRPATSAKHWPVGAGAVTVTFWFYVGHFSSSGSVAGRVRPAEQTGERQAPREPYGLKALARGCLCRMLRRRAIGADDCEGSARRASARRDDSAAQMGLASRRDGGNSPASQA